MRNKSVVTEAKEINLAVELVQLGARLQVLEAETNLSRERLLKLYKEVKGESPPKGMLPFSTDWFMSWQPNIHSSLFIDIYRYLHAATAASPAPRRSSRAYRLYLEHLQVHGLEQVLSLTRAWSLVRFVEAKMLTTVPCTRVRRPFRRAHAWISTRTTCAACATCPRAPARPARTARRPSGRRPRAAAYRVKAARDDRALDAALRPAGRARPGSCARPALE